VHVINILFHMNLKTVLRNHRNIYQTPPNSVGHHDAALTVSFVIPVYNSAETIRFCVESILRQDRSDLVKEIILVDDASSDHSLSVAQSLAVQHRIVHVLQNPGRRYAAYARNRGIERSTGDLVCFIRMTGV
jgi:cellulose synthase/poly-beta-1,6-N-acetylglucosamine synthase-like glycosyltransferase